MARFFQHLEPGDNIGKITRLKYIDDISDDELILYYFEDGSKCSSEFISFVDDDFDPMQAKKKVMAEITGPNNPWVIERHEIVPDEDRIIVGADGVRYQAPDPTTKFAGSLGAQTTSVAEEAKSGIRIEVHPPRKVARFTQEPDNAYLLSEHPNLELNVKSSVDMKKPVTVAKNNKPEHIQTMDVTNVSIKNEITNFDNEFDVDDSTSLNETQQQIRSQQLPQPQPRPEIHFPVSGLPINTLSANNLLIDFDKIKNDEITFIIDNKTYRLNPEEVKKRLTVSSNDYEEALKQSSSMNLSNIMDNEDVLIKNMIDKSKKNKCKITMSLALDIPPQEVYDTIKVVYEEGMAEQFVRSLTARYLSQDNMLSSISDGLKAYYEKHSASVKKEN